MDDSDQTEDHTPRVYLALEYVDGNLNFYVKFFTNYAPLPSCNRRLSRAVIYVASGLNKTTWMGRTRPISNRELSTASVFKTLSVPREKTTTFNEFFSTGIKQHDFEKTMMRIQFCDVDKKDQEIVIGECDLWPCQYATHTFREMLVPQTVCRPDLGELELTVVYLPTAQRFCIDRVKATNLKLEPSAAEVYIRFLLFTLGSFDEIHKSEHKPKQKDEHATYVFNKRIIFDLLRSDITHATVLVQAVELVNGEKRNIGHFGMSASSPICEQGLWRAAMKNPRKQCTAVMRLAPGC